MSSELALAAKVLEHGMEVEKTNSVFQCVSIKMGSKWSAFNGFSSVMAKSGPDIERWLLLLGAELQTAQDLDRSPLNFEKTGL